MAESEAAGGPTVRRMIVGARLRRLREAAGVSRDDAGHVIRGSGSKISRLELGRVGFKQRDVADLLTHYGITDETARRPLLALAQASRSPGWWHVYDEVIPEFFQTYLGLEDSASTLRRFETQVVPGLLQTEEYAEEVMAASIPPVRGGEVDAAVDLRLRRKRRLTSAEPLVAWFVLDEPVLSRGLGRSEAMGRQIDHLIDMSEIPTVIIQLLPARLGGRVTLGGSFSVLRFAEPELPDIVYLEQLTSALYIDKPEQVSRYSVVMEVLSASSLSREETRDRLLALRRGES